MKTFLPLILLMLMLNSCGRKQPAGNTSSNEKLIEQYFAHFNRHEWTQMAEMYADSASFKDPSLGQEVVKQNHQQIIAKYEELAKTFPDVRDEVIKVYPSGSAYIIVEFISRGTAPDKSTFQLPICTIFKFDKGKIVQDFTYYDNFE